MLRPRPLVGLAALAPPPLLRLPSLCASLCVFAGVCTMMVCGYLVKKGCVCVCVCVFVCLCVCGIPSLVAVSNVAVLYHCFCDGQV